MKLFSSIQFQVFLLIFNFIFIPGLYAQATVPKNLNAYIEKVREEFDVPGIAVTIVKDSKVVLAKGYGIKKIGMPDPVDAHTLFGIASNTKAFTATALALLVEEGKIAWNDPVVKHLPGFQLFDPFVTRELSVRDLLVHRSGLGLGAGDLLWWPPSDYNRKEIVRRLRFIPLRTSFRNAYAYDNVLYLAAGELIEAVSGQSWEDFIVSHILNVIGMTESQVNPFKEGAETNMATPHARIDGSVRAVSPFTNEKTNPAGGINSSAADMARWLIVQLDSGRIAENSRLFSQRTTRELWTLITPITISDPPAELSALRSNFKGYALGFEVRDYRNRKLVTHTGGFPGYLSRVAMIPELKLGVAVLTNQESAEAFNAISYHILDHYLSAPATDWIQAYKKILAHTDSTDAAAVENARAKRDSTSHPSLPLASYAGTYSDAWYGDVVIVIENDKLVIRFTHTPSLVGDLVHWQYDTFIARWKDRELRADAYVTFSFHPDASIDQVKMKAVSPATDFSFDFHDLLLKPVQTRPTR